MAEATSDDGAVVSYSEPTASFGLVPASVKCTPASGTRFPIGTTIVTCTAVNTVDPTEDSKRSFHVVVQDTTPPKITDVPADIAREATAPSTPVAYALPKATDAVSGSVPVKCEPGPGSGFPVGSTTVKCTATDRAGNVATASFEVAIKDTTPPVVADPADISAEATGATTPVSYTLPKATDLADPSVTVTCSPASGSSFPLGQTPVICRSSDSSGNTTNVRFQVKVVDTTPPTLSVPEPLTVTSKDADGAKASASAIAAFLSSAEATDRVDGSVPVTNDAPTVFPVGTTTVLFSAVDRAGNATSKAVVVTVRGARSVAVPVRRSRNGLRNGDKGQPAPAELPAGATETTTAGPTVTTTTPEAVHAPPARRDASPVERKAGSQVTRNEQSAATEQPHHSTHHVSFLPEPARGPFAPWALALAVGLPLVGLALWAELRG